MEAEMGNGHISSVSICGVPKFVSLESSITRPDHLLSEARSEQKTKQWSDLQSN